MDSDEMNQGKAAIPYSCVLDSLPSEILLHICSFLDAKTILHTLSQVSQTLHDIFSGDTFWKIRIGKRWPKKYPAIPVGKNEFNWKAACEAREEQNRLWERDAQGMEEIHYSEGIFAPVDSIHFMKDTNLLCAGSRDRYLNVIDVSKLDVCDQSSVKHAGIFSTNKIHKGWIWCMSSLDGTIITGSWDTSIAFTDLERCEVDRRVKCKSAVLSLHCEPNEIFAGTYGKHVFRVDPRAAEVIGSKVYHSGPVLAMVGTDNYCITGSEDGTLVVYDRRANSVLHSTELPSYPMSIAIDRDELWVGDKGGSVHLLDASDGELSLVESYDDWHREKVTGIIHNLGCMITSSTDATIAIRQASLDPDLITTLQPNALEITRICSKNNMLAAACAKGAVKIWRPKLENL